MRKDISLLLFFLFTLCIHAGWSQITPAIDILHYRFDLSLNDSNDIIQGKTSIILKYRSHAESIELDLKNQNSSGKGMNISTVLYNGRKTSWTHSGNILIIEVAGTTGSDSVANLLITYSGIPADGLIISENKFGNRTFFADHWPDRASNYLPVVDNPSDKATVEFVITAPSHYKVVASGYIIEESDLPGGNRITHWKEDVPLPVKVMAFGAASFAMQFAGSVKGTPVWTYVYPENRLEGFSDYSAALKPLEFFMELIGPYSYEKLANVQSKTIFGGLENAGCIFYSENSVTGKGRAENLIVHEIAHQWFGNSVTEKEWHHIWLSEGFATYLTAVYLEMNYGKERLYETMKSARDRVIRAYERGPAPVIDTTVTDLMELLSTNSYQKGAWVLHMLRSEIGDEAFWRGIRLFYSRFRNANALTDDLKEVMEEVSRKDLGAFFHQWLNIAGQPDLVINYKPSEKGLSTELIIEQTQDYLYKFNLELGIKDDNGERVETVRVKDRVTRINLRTVKGAAIVIDPEVKFLFRIINN